MVEKVSIAVIFFTMSMLFAQSAPDSSFILKKSEPQPIIYDGKAIYSNRANLSFPYESSLNFIINANSEVKGASLNEKGEVTEPGTLIASVSSDGYKAALESAELQLSIDLQNLRDAQTEFSRQQSLLRQKATSQTSFERAVSSLFAAKQKYAMAHENIRSARSNYQNCFIYAPFSGVVEDVRLQIGSSTKKGEPVAVLSAVSPMKITIPLDRGITAELSQTDCVKIFVGANALELEAWVDPNMIFGDHIDVLVNNPLVDPMPEIPGTDSFKRVKRMGLVPYFRLADGTKTIGVSPRALMTDSGQNSFVFKGKTLSFSDEGKIFPRIFQVEKIPVTLYNTFSNSGPYYIQRISSESIRPHDMVVLDPENLNDGDTVLFCDKRRLLRNGDDVKVMIPSVRKNGFYVPPNMIHYRKNGFAEVFAESGSSVKAIPVKILRYYDKRIQIDSPELKEGLRLLSPQ